MVTKEELVALDNWRFSRRMPSRAAAIRELLRRGLSAEGFTVSDGSIKSGDFSLISASDAESHGSSAMREGGQRLDRGP
jgi:hypothetical protein